MYGGMFASASPRGGCGLEPLEDDARGVARGMKPSKRSCENERRFDRAAETTPPRINATKSNAQRQQIQKQRTKGGKRVGGSCLGGGLAIE